MNPRGCDSDVRVPDEVLKCVGFIGEVERQDATGIYGEQCATGFFVAIPYESLELTESQIVVLTPHHCSDAEVRCEAELRSAWTGEAPVPHTSMPYPLPLAISTARSTARDLFSDSSNSRCGSESATIPAPACR